MVETRTLAEAFAETAGPGKGLGRVKLYSVEHHLALEALVDAIDTLNPNKLLTLKGFVNSKEPEPDAYTLLLAIAKK